MLLQTLLRGYFGMLVEIKPDNDKAICRLWNQIHLPEVWDFPTVDEARRWAEREYAIPPDAWMASERVGSRTSMIEVLQAMGRPLTCDEMCAAVAIAYETVAFDAQGLRVFPTPEPCLTSFNVVTDLPETLDWIREDCTLLQVRVTNNYGFVADVCSSDLAPVEASREYQELKRLLTEAAGIARWLPAYPPDVWTYRAPEGSGPLAGVINRVIEKGNDNCDGTISGYTANAIGLARSVQLLRAKSTGIELRERPFLMRAAEIVLVDDTPHVVLAVTREVAEWVYERDWYRTSVDGVLRQAARRREYESFTDVPLADVREAFEHEVQAWQEWAAPAPPPPPVPAHLVWDRELEDLLAEAEGLNDNSEAIFELAKRLQQRGVFIAEHVSGGPPHVVKRTVVAALKQLTPGSRD